MKKAFGKNAERVAKRITALRAFDTLGEVKAYDPLGRWHELSGDRMGQWSGNTSERHRIIVKPDFDGSEVSATDATQGTVLECNINYHEK